MALSTLPEGYRLIGQYVIRNVLGSGGFGITYDAQDTTLDHAVAIKEYFPRSLVKRAEDWSVRAEAGAAAATSKNSSRPMEIDASTAIQNIPDNREADVFAWGRQRFVDEARTLARIKHATIPQIFRIFEANGTAYIAIERIEGESLRALLSQRKALQTQAEVDRIVEPLLEALAILHEADVLHRDVSPNNIMIRSNGSPVLLDFGSARTARRDVGFQGLTVVTPSFAAPEQYTFGLPDGPFTDIYGAAAVFYEMIAGEKVSEAHNRLLKEEYHPLSRRAHLVGFRAEFLRAVDWGLSLEPSKRPQSIAEWQAGLYPWKGLSHRSALNRTRGRKVFVSYRRADSRPQATLIYESLVQSFGKNDVFFDVDSIPYGVDFRTHIRGSILDSAVVVAVIGPRWTKSLTSKPWRIWRKQAEDFVRIELELALEYGVPIIPVLANGAYMPTKNNLPKGLEGLTYANALVLSPIGDDGGNLARIAAAIRQFRD